MRPILYILIVLLLIPAILVGVAALLLANPDLYRDRLASTFKTATGLELEIGGDLNWRYWPLIALEVEQIKIRPPDVAEPVAQFRRAAIDLELLPLVMGGDNIAIDGILLDGLEVNLVVDEQGNANWRGAQQQPQEAAEEKAPTGGEDTASTFGLEITRIEINDGHIEYRDASTGQHYVVDIPAISTGAVVYDEPVTLDAQVTLTDKQAGIGTTTSANGELTFNRNFSQFSLNNMTLKNTLTLPDMPELQLDTTLNGTVDLDEGTAEINESMLALSELRATFSLTVGDMFGTPHYGGALTVSPFNARELLKDLGQEVPDMASEDALTSVEFSTNIAGEMPEVRFEKVLAKLDNSLLKGNGGLVLGDKTGIKFDLTLDQINATDYLPPAPPDTGGESDTEAAGDAKPADMEAIPVDMLHAFNIDGRLQIDELRYEPYQLTSMIAKVENRGGKLTADVSAQGYDGSLRMDATVNTGSATSGRLQVGVSDLNITKLTEWEWITGTLNADSATTFKGSMLSDILASVDGPTTFNIVDGTLDVTPVKRLAAQIDALRGKTSSIAEWPDTMPFEQLEGKHRLNQGIAGNQIVGFTLENMNIAGTGGVDYWQDHLSYDLEITLEESQTGRFPVNPRLTGIGWPLHCEGALDDSPVDMCRPDADGIKGVLADAAKQEIKRKGEEKLREKIEEKVPEDLKDKTRGLLKGLFDG